MFRLLKFAYDRIFPKRLSREDIAKEKLSFLPNSLRELCLKYDYDINDKLKYIFKYMDTSICSVNNLPDKRVIYGTISGELKIWNKKTNKYDYISNKSGDSITCIIPLPDNKVAFDSNNNFIILDLNTNISKVINPGHRDKIFSLIALPNNQVASCSLDNSIKIWDLTEDKLKFTLISHGLLFCARFLSNNRIIAKYSSGKYPIWDLITGKLIFGCEPSIENAYIINEMEIMHNNLRISSNKKTCSIVINDGRIVYGTREGDIILWNPISQKEDLKFRAHFCQIDCIIYTPNNKIITVSAAKTLKVWDIFTQVCECEIDTPFKSFTCQAKTLETYISLML